MESYNISSVYPKHPERIITIIKQIIILQSILSEDNAISSFIWQLSTTALVCFSKSLALLMILFQLQYTFLINSFV